MLSFNFKWICTKCSNCKHVTGYFSSLYSFSCCLIHILLKRWCFFQWWCHSMCKCKNSISAETAQSISWCAYIKMLSKCFMSKAEIMAWIHFLEGHLKRFQHSVCWIVPLYLVSMMPFNSHRCPRWSRRILAAPNVTVWMDSKHVTWNDSWKSRFVSW